MSYNFKDNLTLENNKFLKWTNNANTTRGNIIGLDTSNNTVLNSFTNSNILINQNVDSFTILNQLNAKPVVIKSALNIGCTSNSVASLTIVNSGYIGIQNSSGYLGLSGSDLYDTSTSRVQISKNSIDAYNLLNYNLYTAELLRQNINSSGIISYLPNGFTPRVVISDTASNYYNPLVIHDTTL
jgi:hypothetical protein